MAKEEKKSGILLGVSAGLVALSVIVLVSYGHVKHSQSTLNGLLLYCLFTGIGTGIAALLWALEEDETEQDNLQSFKIVLSFFAFFIIITCIVATYDFFAGGGLVPPIMIVGIALLVLLVTTLILVLSHIARRKNPNIDAGQYVKAVPIIAYVLITLTGVLGRSMLRRFAVPPVTFMQNQEDWAKNMFQLTLYSLPITSACIWGASIGFFNKLLLPFKMILQTEAGDFEANAQEVANAVNVVKNGIQDGGADVAGFLKKIVAPLKTVKDIALAEKGEFEANTEKIANPVKKAKDSIRDEAAEYKALQLTDDNIGEFAKKSLIHIAVQTGDMFVMEEEHVRKTMLTIQETSHRIRKTMLPILRALYPLSPSGLPMLLRTAVATTLADTIAQKCSVALSKKVKNKSALATGTFITIFLSILTGGLGVAATLVGLCYIPIKVLPNFLGAWKDQSPLDIAQVMTFRLIRIIDLRGYSGVGDAECLLDYMCYVTYKLWTRFKEADALCHMASICKEPNSINLEDAVEIKKQAYQTFKKTAEAISIDLLNITPAEKRGFLDNATFTTMQQCLSNAETAARENNIDELPGIIQEMTKALIDPNMKLMKAHRVLYVVALCFIALMAGIGNAVGASLSKKKDVTIDRQREVATTTLIVSCIIIVSINAYLALK